MRRNFVITIFLVLLCSACSPLRSVKWENMYSPFEQLHIDEKTTYENSPFTKLINVVFKTGITALPGNAPHYVDLLNTGEDAFLARVHLIRNAKRSILLQTYIWDKDECGRFFIKELIEAANRGVKVKVLIDAMGATKDLDLLAYFADASPNLEIKFYNPNVLRINPSALQIASQMAIRLDGMNKRMHNKTLIIDDQIAIMGGRNYQNDYFDMSSLRNFKDRDVLVVGPIAKQVTDSFIQYWAFHQAVYAKDMLDIGALMKNKTYKTKITDQTFDFNDLFKDAETQLADLKFIDQRFVNSALLVKHLQFIVDLPGKNFIPGLASGSDATDALLDILQQAKKQIIFQTPYLVLDTYLVKNIRKLKKQNKDLDILISTNSLAATDHITAYAQSFKQKSFFVDALRFRIFEFKPVPKDIEFMLPNYKKHPPEFFPAYKDSILEWAMEPISVPPNRRYVCIHAKSFVIDDQVGWVGSFNLDPRSAHLNTELGVVIWDTAFTKLLKDNIDVDMATGNSWVVGRRNNVPVVKQLNMFIDKTMETLPLGDVWPFQHITMFELKEGAQPVPFYDNLFYKNYQEVGSFPEVPFPQGQIKVILLKAFIGLAKPLM
ncbi:MAG: phospholipase D family protein [Candidatus Omnitrophica bacterium]|nr:phospholipase D family protein [Candidatus Omnitrophota bacterium]